jgi:hypothetical protein
MSDETAEVFGADEAPTPLATPTDVRRALAKTLRRIEKGTVSHHTGQVLINGYGSLAKMMRETIADDVLQRMQQLERRQAEVEERATSH